MDMDMDMEKQLRDQETSYPPLSNPISVISTNFVTPQPTDLTIVRKLISVTDGNFAVADSNGQIMFKVKGSLLSLHERRTLLDASDRPIASLRQKIFSAHRRWQVYRGESSSEDLIFSAKKSSLLQYKTELDVFLGSNAKEDVCDFKVRGSYLERSCTVYSGHHSSTVIAHMHRKHNLQSMFLGNDTFGVTVYPNIDYAFIVALIVILDEINEGDDSD